MATEWQLPPARLPDTAFARAQGQLGTIMPLKPKGKALLAKIKVDKFDSRAFGRINLLLGVHDLG